MGDLSRYSDEELRAMMKQASVEQNARSATHFGEGVGSGTGFREDFGVGGGEMLRAGIGRGLVSVGRNLKEMALYNVDLPEAMRTRVDIEDANERDKALLADRAGNLGSMIGQGAATAPFAMATGGAASALGISSPIATGALEGGVQGLLSANPDDRLSGALMGAGVGAAVPAIGAGVRKLASGMNMTPEARMLRQMGVDLTPGQMNPQGTMNTLEQAWESVPVVGNVVKGARGSAEDQFKQAVLQQGGAPGATVQAGHDLADTLTNAYGTYDAAYDAVRHFPVAGTRTGIARGLAATANDPAVLADDGARQTVGRWLQNQATQLPRGSALQSGDLLELRSAIRDRLRNVTDDAQRGLLENAEQQLTQHLNSQLPQDAATSLAATDAQYSRYKILENAMRKAKDRPGGFSMSQFSQAIQEATPSGVYARGGGSMRDLASAGTESFQTTMPNTGGRNAAIALSLAAAPASVPFGIGAIGTQTGRALMAGETAPQQAAQALISAGSRALTPAQKRLLSETLQRMAVAGAVQSGSTGSP